MTCHTLPRSSGRSVDSTPDNANASAANGVRCGAHAEGRLPDLRQALAGRSVALRIVDALYPGEVACDLPGGRVLVRIVGSSVYVWGRQCAAPRLVQARSR